MFGLSRSAVSRIGLPCTIAAVLSALTVAVYALSWGSESELPSITVVAFAAGVFVALWVVLAAVLALLFRRAESTSSQHVGSTSGRNLSFDWSPRGILTASAAILVLWAPLVISAYPCTMDWDTLNQLFQYATEAPVNYGVRAVDVTVDAKFIDHDPLATTLLFGFFWQIGVALGDQNVGLFLFAILQSAFSAFSLGVLCCYVRRLGCSRFASWASFAFCALFPIFARYGATMLKDSLFSPFFLLYCMSYVEVFRTDGRALGSKWWVLLLALSALGLALSKKSGIYVLLIATAVMVVRFRGKWKVAAAVGLLPTSALLLMPVLLYPALDVASVGRQEALAVPFQQSAAVVVECSNDVRPWEREALEAVYDCDSLDQRFNPTLADPVKAGFNTEADSGDLARFVLAYVSMGVRHPILYLEVVLRLDGPMLVPMRALSVPTWTGYEGIAEMSEREGASSIDFSKPSWAEPLFELANGYCQFVLSAIGLFGTLGFYGGWLPFISCAVVFARNRPMFLALTPIAASVLVLLLSPVSTGRYVLPLVYCAPLLVTLTVIALRRGRVVADAA